MPIEYQNIVPYEQQLQQKISQYSEYMKDYMGNLSPPIFRSPRQHYRQRAGFRVWHQGNQCYFAMTDKETKQLVRIEQLSIVDTTINELMQSVLNILNYIEELRNRLFSIEFLVNTGGEAVITLIYHKSLDSHWRNAAEGLRQQLSKSQTVNIVGRSRKQKLVVGVDYIQSRFLVGGRDTYFCHVEGSFTQPNAAINQEMIGWVHAVTTTGTGHLHNSDALELYCGNGNFTLVLAMHYRRVLATEISKSGINALNWALRKNSTIM